MIKRQILNADGSLMVVKVELAEGFHGDVDQHLEEQVTFVKKGLVEFEVNGEKRVMKEGDSVYVPSNVIHRVKVLEACELLDIFTPVRKDIL